jgi:hypothetical protein
MNVVVQLILLILLGFPVPAAAHEGYHGHDQDRWHASAGTSFEPDYVFCIVMPLET